MKPACATPRLLRASSTKGALRAALTAPATAIPMPNMVAAPWVPVPQTTAATSVSSVAVDPALPRLTLPTTIAWRQRPARPGRSACLAACATAGHTTAAPSTAE